jgi:hypothetical protein
MKAVCSFGNTGNDYSLMWHYPKRTESWGTLHIKLKFENRSFINTFGVSNFGSVINGIK